MAGWAGFSEEELRNLKTKQDLPHHPDRPRRQPTSAKPTAAKSRQQMQRKLALQVQSQLLAKQDGSLCVPAEQQLSRSSITSSPNVITCPAEKKQVIHDQPEMSTSVSPGIDLKGKDLFSEQDGELNKKDMELREKSRLDQLQMEQRLMEEKNKRKKALLAKAIAERKRYDKAEAEYILAKVDLHKKTELKEQLTEHLCTIIQQNEARKAKKLEELMQQLEVEADEEKLELEIEVEQMLLQQQEAEAKKKLVATPETEVQFASPTEKNSEPSEKETSADQNGLCQSSPHLTAESCVEDNSTDQSSTNSLSEKQPV
ncbi:hypothetical protein XENTR_v10012402 [Xenopus tropicalis]|nr:hypothetical protein XENTR_v10012402 [Xenopus tropicalis]